MRMQKMLRFKWLVLFTWVLLTVLAIVTMPDLGKLTREQGQPAIPDHYPSNVARQLENKLGESDKGKGKIAILAVFHDPNRLSADQMKEIEAALDRLEKKGEPAVSDMMTPFQAKELEEQLWSKDKTTVMATFNVQQGNRTVKEVREGIYQSLSTLSMEQYLTGPDLINEDFSKTALDGVRKTELITVGFIIIILLVIFRSPITPLISLLSVGISYGVSMSVVAHLVEKWDFPFATFTQIFLVLVLFGIGTDYNILLFSRFKEELSKGKSIVESIAITYKTAGRTVFYSGLAVVIGFSTLGLAQFSIYQAGAAVAIGAFVLLLVLWTVIPFFMALLGEKMFWPIKGIKGHGENRVWTALSTFSFKRPLISLLFVSILTVPILFFHNDSLSYNNLEEVDESLDSVKGFNKVSEHFSPGKTMPATVILESDQSLDSAGSLAFIDQMTDTLERISGVELVYGPTRPEGTPIQELYIQDQSRQTKKGLGKANDGTEEIQKGLKEVNKKLEAGSSGDFSKVEELVEGTAASKSGVGKVNLAMKKIQSGLKEGADGAGQIHGGVRALHTGMEQLSSSTDKISTGLDQLHRGYRKFGKGYQNLGNGLEKAQKGIKVIDSHVDSLESRHDELKSDPSFIAIKQTSSSLAKEFPQLTSGMKNLNRQYETTLGQFAQVNKGLKGVTAGQKKLASGADKLQKGSAELAEGISQGSKGQEQVIHSLSKVEEALEQIHGGQQKVAGGLDAVSKDLYKLKSGLSQSADGLEGISGGLDKVESYLGELSKTNASRTFFVPEEIRKGGAFQQALDTYMSKNRHVMKWNIILDEEPYSENAMEVADAINRNMTDKLQNTDFENARFGVGGISSQNNDMNQISTQDLNRTAMWMLLGISIVLLLILRSFWNTVFIVGSLILSYFTALTVAQLIFIEGLGYPGLAWNTPFFSLIMIFSLGVDYSIFLMMRFREYRHLTPGEAIIQSAKKVGGVVLSAAVILSGTFAALYPSGVLTLVQIATVVIIGLLVLSALMLPVLIPALISITQRLNTDPEVSDSGQMTS